LMPYPSIQFQCISMYINVYLLYFYVFLAMILNQTIPQFDLLLITQTS